MHQPSGDQTAYRVLFDTYKTRVFRAAMMITRNESLAEEATQEAFYRTFSRLGSLRDTKKFGAWVCTIAVNYARDLLKERGACYPYGDLSRATTAEEQTDPEAVVVRREEHEALARALRMLPAHQCQVLILYYYEEMTIIEIADFLGVTEGTVKSRLFRARQALMKLLGFSKPKWEDKTHDQTSS